MEIQTSILAPTNFCTNLHIEKAAATMQAAFSICNHGFQFLDVFNYFLCQANNYIVNG